MNNLRKACQSLAPVRTSTSNKGSCLPSVPSTKARPLIIQTPAMDVFSSVELGAIAAHALGQNRLRLRTSDRSGCTRGQPSYQSQAAPSKGREAESTGHKQGRPRPQLETKDPRAAT
eukprot:6187083-Pleurochrysis_carterae.AAC.2